MKYFIKIYGERKAWSMYMIEWWPTSRNDEHRKVLTVGILYQPDRKVDSMWIQCDHHIHLDDVGLWQNLNTQKEEKIPGSQECESKY